MKLGNAGRQGHACTLPSSARWDPRPEPEPRAPKVGELTFGPAEPWATSSSCTMSGTTGPKSGPKAHLFSMTRSVLAWWAQRRAWGSTPPDSRNGSRPLRRSLFCRVSSNGFTGDVFTSGRAQVRRPRAETSAPSESLMFRRSLISGRAGASGLPGRGTVGGATKFTPPPSRGQPEPCFGTSVSTLRFAQATRSPASFDSGLGSRMDVPGHRISKHPSVGDPCNGSSNLPQA